MNADEVGVELRHLRVVVAVAETGSVTGAAARLATGQPAVSRALAQLESRLGVRLVNRTTRSVELTAAGEAFREAAVRALAAVDDAVAAAHGSRTVLRVGFSWSAAGRHTVPLLRAWRDRYPGVPVELRRHDDRSAGLSTGEVDLALVRGRLEDRRFVHVELFREGRCVAVADGDPLASRPSLRLADLARRPLALSTVSGTTTLSLWPAGAEPVVVADTRNIDDWLAVIASGTAVGVTAASTPEQHPAPGVRFVPLADAPPLVTWLVWDRRRDHPARADFTRLARNVVRTSRRDHANRDDGRPGA